MRRRIDWLHVSLWILTIAFCIPTGWGLGRILGLGIGHAIGIPIADKVMKNRYHEFTAYCQLMDERQQSNTMCTPIIFPEGHQLQFTKAGNREVKYELANANGRLIASGSRSLHRISYNSSDGYGELRFPGTGVKSYVLIEHADAGEMTYRVIPMRHHWEG